MITSTANAQVKELVRLMKKSRARDEAGVFLIEGPRMAGELTADPAWQGKIRKIYLSESYAKKNAAEAEALNRAGRTEILADPVFDHVSGTKTPQGILAVVERRDYRMPDILGAEAAGVTGIILSSDCVDIYNPKVVRSTMGAVLRMPFLYVEDLPGAIGELKKEGLLVYAAHLAGERAYDEEDYTTGCAFLIGNEGNGLRDEVAACADRRILIPMCGRAESLNAAVAAAVLMFEAGRQRRK